MKYIIFKNVMYILTWSLFQLFEMIKDRNTKRIQVTSWIFEITEVRFCPMAFKNFGKTLLHHLFYFYFPGDTKIPILPPVSSKCAR